MQPVASRFSNNPRCYDLGSFWFVGPRPAMCETSDGLETEMYTPFAWMELILYVQCLDHISSDACAYRAAWAWSCSCYMFAWFGTGVSSCACWVSRLPTPYIVHIAWYMWALWPDLTRLLESKTFTKQLMCCGLLTWPRSFAGDIWLRAQIRVT